jgi:FkbH-like protein
VDLDETLWGGVVGEGGWQRLTLGGHDPAGEALVDFQRELKALTRQGVVLAIVSKNQEEVALEALEKHPEMVLGTGDFAAWRINWQEKARNIMEIAAELNVGLEAAVFIDDNPAERAWVREALPEVLVPDWPADKRFYREALLGLDCFDKPTVTEEDRRRSSMYVQERQRTELKKRVATIDEWLHTLETKVHVETLQESDLSRAVQLLNKTNQMNLATRRMTELELISWAGEAARQVWTFRVSDRFGEAGLVGVASAEKSGRGALLRDFVLSCRVMGRKVEETMLHVAVTWVRRQGLEELRAVYLPTERNTPCRDFLLRSGLRPAGENEFVWDAKAEYPLPPAIGLAGEG